MTRRLRKSTGKIKARKWWALLNHPKDLPVLFDSYESAVANRDPDEYVVQVDVAASNLRNRLRKWARS